MQLTPQKQNVLVQRKNAKDKAKEILCEATNHPKVQALIYEEPGRVHSPTRLLIVDGSSIDRRTEDRNWPKHSAMALLSNCLNDPVRVLDQTEVTVSADGAEYTIKVLAVEHREYEAKFCLDMAATKFPQYSLASWRERIKYRPLEVIALLATSQYFLGSFVVAR